MPVKIPAQAGLAPGPCLKLKGPVGGDCHRCAEPLGRVERVHLPGGGHAFCPGCCPRCAGLTGASAPSRIKIKPRAGRALARRAPKRTGSRPAGR